MSNISQNSTVLKVCSRFHTARSIGSNIIIQTRNFPHNQHLARKETLKQKHYGSAVYGSAKDHVLSKLNPVHHAGIRIATGAYRTSPVPSLYVESDIPPLFIRRMKLVMNYVTKISACPLNPAHKILLQDVPNLLFQTTKKPLPLACRFRKLDVFASHLSTCKIEPYLPPVPPWSAPFPSVDCTLSASNKSDTSAVIFRKEFMDVINNVYKDHTLCFTDGSKTVDSASCAYSIGDEVCSIKLSPIISIYTAELLAIVQCMEKITQLPSPSPQYLIVSDSESSLCAIKNVKSNNNPLVNRIYQLWLQLKSVEVILRFLWCPSHCGITGNEVVDRAAQSENHNFDLNVITPDDMSPFIKKMCLSSWQNEWNNVNPNNKLKSIKPEIGRWDSSYRPNRYQEVVLTRLRIGHTRLTHSFLFTKSPPPICECGEPLTVKHVILSCPIHEPLRHTYDTTPSLGNSTASVDAVMDLLNRLELFHLI
ncbi:hypothetical protein M8J77_009525 [Diaphorina citri]|nr:hypothetical protein M8J77_009525 [Diaphorina citri]